MKGISFFYTGFIRDRKLLPALAEEMQDICSSLGWHYHYFDAAEPGGLEGIYFSPENCSPLFLTFDGQDRLLSPISQITCSLLKEKGLKPDPVYGVECSTQFAGPDVHITLIRLFRYLADKYFHDFGLEDTGRYWETGNRETLEKQFLQGEKQLIQLRDALETLDLPDTSGHRSLEEKIEALLRKKK